MTRGTQRMWPPAVHEMDDEGLASESHGVDVLIVLLREQPDTRQADGQQP
jgi:hypothetical protein